MPTAAKEEKLCAPMVWTDTCVLPLAAAGVYPKTRVWGSKPENVHCSSATAPLRIELRRGCEESSEKTTVGSGVSFKYDPFGRRIYKSSSAGTSAYAYDADNLMEETDATGGVVARYSQGLNIDEPLAMLRSGATSYYHGDGLGSVTSLSNTAGALAQTYTFDSFGKQTASSGSLTNPFQYTGRELDSETGLYFNRARYLDPTTGRFISEDPVRLNGGSTNFYMYAQNDPIDLYDIDGLSPSGSCKPKCDAQLGFRPVKGLPEGINATHSFWYVKDRHGAQFIVSGGPSGENGTGNLNVWVVPGTANGDDNRSQPVHWQAPTSNATCDLVDGLLNAARDFPKQGIAYHPIAGPNSNSAARYLGDAGGFNVPSGPPGSVGWSAPIFRYVP